MTDTPDLRAMVVKMMDQCAEDVLNGTNYLRNFCGVDREGKLFMVCAPAEGEQGEVNVIRYLKMLFLANDIQGYCMVSETWTSSDPSYSRGQGSMPMNDPERGEAISGIYLMRTPTPTGGLMECRAMGRRRITRNPTAVGELEWIEQGREATDMTGRFFELLPPLDLVEKIRPEFRAQIKDALHALQPRFS